MRNNLAPLTTRFGPAFMLIAIFGPTALIVLIRMTGLGASSQDRGATEGTALELLPLPGSIEAAATMLSFSAAPPSFSESGSIRRQSRGCTRRSVIGSSKTSHRRGLGILAPTRNNRAKKARFPQRAAAGLQFLRFHRNRNSRARPALRTRAQMQLGFHARDVIT